MTFLESITSVACVVSASAVVGFFAMVRSHDRDIAELKKANHSHPDGSVSYADCQRNVQRLMENHATAMEHLDSKIDRVQETLLTRMDSQEKKILRMLDKR